MSLKIHPKFKIYGIGYADTIKDLVTEGFVEDWAVPQLPIVEVTNEEDGIYSVDGPEGTIYKGNYDGLYAKYAPQAADEFLVAVCDVDMELIGFIYS